MAKFKIYLLNLRSSDTYFTPQYSILPVSEFNTEYDENISYGTTNITTQKYYTATLKQTQTINYTYNEKFEKHQNTQRTLSFSMNRNVIRVDRIEKNPFINYMFVGAQLLLVDKYDKHHLMTISKISYEFKEQNTIFNYECQDSFNYQLSRQNNGYEITNDVSSASFIGAQSLDWWVLCKIHPDCKISYSYKQLQDVVKISNDYGHVDVIKSAYLRNEYPELYKMVPFAASGTASSVLIALGELYGLQLQVYERLDFNTGVLTKYYWFEPSKSLRPTGLKYSPYLDLQSFSLSHNGQSFSSILNIQNHTIGDEIITVLPSVPNFFRQWFETSEWENTEYHAGLFSSACQNTTDVTEWNLAEIVHWEEDGQNKIEKFTRYYNERQCFYYEDDHNNQLVYIPLTANFSSQYDYISFTPGADTYSTLTLVGLNPHTYCSKFGDWKVVGLFELATSEVNTDGNYVPVYKTYELELIANHTPIPMWVKNATLKYLFLTLDSSNDSQVSTIDGILYFSQVRDASDEELEFAAIADQLPWLENKLVDFNYFYEHSIITMVEYNKLMHILENDLRKVNAKLLLYSQLYYQSMQQRTKVISMLSSKLDKIGAVFQSDFIRPFQSAGRITETTEFSLALDDLVNNSANTAQLTDNYWYMQNETNQWSDLKSCQGQLISFINYYETLTDYVNYYINSEQTFLKNMYLFREYFETNANLNKIHMYTFTLPDQYNNSKLIAFNHPNHYVKLTEENIHYTIYEKKDDLYIPYNPDQIVSQSNATDFYYLNTSETTMCLVSKDPDIMSSYSKDQQYYEQQWIVTIADGYTWPVDDNGKPHRFVYGNQIDGNGNSNRFEFELITASKIQMRCYRHCLHTVNIDTTPATVLNIQFDGNETTTNVTVNQQIYELVSLGEIRINYFYKTIIEQKSTRLADFYIHRRIASPWKAISNIATNADWALSFNDLGLSWVTLQPLINSKNWSSSRIGNGKDDENDNVYKECFPLTSLYWYGRKANNKGELDEEYDYHSVPFVNIENCAQFYRRIAVSLEEYKNWQLGLSITGGGMLSSDIPFVRIITTGNLIAPMVWGICNAVWNNRSTTFGNSGWTYHDVFDCSHDEFQAWSNSTRLLYTKSAEGYNLTNKTYVFPGEAFNIQDRTWTEADDQKHQIVNYNWGYHEATNLLFTYYSFNYRLPNDVANKYHYKPSYWRILKQSDVIAKTDKIGMILTSNSSPLFIQKGVPDTLNFVDLKLETTELTVNSGVNTINRLNSVVYYPLRNYIASIGGADFHWSVNSSQASLSDLLLNSGMSGVWDDYRFVDTDKGAVAIFVREESWSYEKLPQNPGQLTVDDIVSYSNSVYYDNGTMQPINLIELCPDIADDFYVTGRITTDYTKIPNNFVLSNELQYYSKVGNTFERRYTRQQLIDQDNMYVKLSDTYSYQSFSDMSETSTICYIYNKTMQDGKVSYVLDTTESCKIYKDTSGWKIRSTSITNPLPISVQYHYYDLSTYTNGLFWYVYKDSDISLLMEKALLIETNLTEYWTNAYYASKNCKYFLPEYWQPVVDNQNNYFSSSILSVNHVRHEYDTEVIDNIYADDLVSESKFYSITKNTSSSSSTYTIKTKLADFNAVTVNYRFDTTNGNATLVDANNSTGTLSSVTGASISIEYENKPDSDFITEPITNSGYNSLELTLDNRGNLTIKDNFYQRRWNTTKVNIHGNPLTIGEAKYDGSLELTITYHQKPVDVVNQISLSNIYIPQVTKTPQSAYYKLRHSNIADSTTSTIARIYHLQTDQYDTLPWLANNFDYIKNISDYLQLNITEWLVHRIDVGSPHTYYEPVNGGTTWSEILNTLSRGAFVESKFGGWYDMMVWTLQSGTYNNYDPIQYRQAQEEHSRIWTEIYTKYPNIIYEQSYTNESATSSAELLQLAQYAFRDYTQVENNYNITVIDPNTLKGYRGQELHIGDGIELDAQELYDDQDSDIYRSLIQYLYITDISYDLRRDDNIQLTVNSIKYQDKVIGQLIKLIR